MRALIKCHKFVNFTICHYRFLKIKFYNRKLLVVNFVFENLAKIKLFNYITTIIMIIMIYPGGLSLFLLATFL